MMLRGASLSNGFPPVGCGKIHTLISLEASFFFAVSKILHAEKSIAVPYHLKFLSGFGFKLNTDSSILKILVFRSCFCWVSDRISVVMIATKKNHSRIKVFPSGDTNVACNLYIANCQFSCRKDVSCPK